jgi:hypothetical protein
MTSDGGRAAISTFIIGSHFAVPEAVKIASRYREWQ